MKNFFLTIAVVSILMFSCKEKTVKVNVTPEEAKAIAKEAYIFAFPMIMNYNSQVYTTNANSPGYRAPFNTIVNDTLPADYTRKDVITMNADTPYSPFGIDLRTEPMVLSVPEIKDRYYVFQLVDLFTHNFGYIGTRATGGDAADFLIVGPSYKGEIPKGRFKEIFYSESELISAIGRTQLLNAEDLPNVHKIQSQYKLTPLSTFLGNSSPTPAPELKWIPSDFKVPGDFKFINFFNFDLALIQPYNEEDKGSFERFAKIGIKPGLVLDETAYSNEVLKAINEGAAEGLEAIKGKAANISKKVNGWNMTDAFGNREYFKGDHLLRAAGAMVGILANTKIEAFYPIAYVDSEGETLNANKHSYFIHFSKNQIPPAKYFWSVTMYDKTADGVSGYLVKNVINRYLINSTTEGLVYNKDGGLNIYIQHDEPTDSNMKANWLPAPDSEFYVAIRIYGPEESALSGEWEPPGIIINDAKK